MNDGQNRSTRCLFGSEWTAASHTELTLRRNTPVPPPSTQTQCHRRNQPHKRAVALATVSEARPHTAETRQ